MAFQLRQPQSDRSVIGRMFDLETCQARRDDVLASGDCDPFRQWRAEPLGPPISSEAEASSSAACSTYSSRGHRAVKAIRHAGAGWHYSASCLPDPRQSSHADGLRNGRPSAQQGVRSPRVRRSPSCKHLDPGPRESERGNKEGPKCGHCAVSVQANICHESFFLHFLAAMSQYEALRSQLAAQARRGSGSRSE